MMKSHHKMSGARQSCSAYILFVRLINYIYSYGVMFFGLPASVNLFIIFLFIFRSQIERGCKACGW